LEHYAEDVLYVPWCTTVASALEQLRRRERQVAAVVNEFGETIGVLTMEDILHTVFTSHPSRSARLLKRAPITPAGDGGWLVTGMTSLRRLGRHFALRLPATDSVTVAGVVHEALEHLPRPLDRCRWGPFDIEVLEANDGGQLLVKLTPRIDQEDET
jgi:CBS domain containing-hemolysin-like protein